MKFFSWGKDGGPESKVKGFWFVEIKPLFSIVLLRFSHGSREAYHGHAFNCFSWVLKGSLQEKFLYCPGYERCTPKDTRWHMPSWKPFVTRREDFHKVSSYGTTWVLSFRGPWDKEWEEYDEITQELYTLKQGRIKAPDANDYIKAKIEAARENRMASRPR